MARIRISTTVDGQLLGQARTLGVGASDPEIIDAALTALLATHRQVTIDPAYSDAYAKSPIGSPDEWGDLASFREAAASS